MGAWSGVVGVVGGVFGVVVVIGGVRGTARVPGGVRARVFRQRWACRGRRGGLLVFGRGGLRLGVFWERADASECPIEVVLPRPAGGKV